MTADRATSSVTVLAERIASIPQALQVAATIELPNLARVPSSVVTTGIGASEGPARFLACTLSELGIAARFVPLTAFALGSPQADLLVVFSQNLSPNARLALPAQHRFGARWLVTSAGFQPGASARESFLATYHAEGVELIQVPPGREDGMLLRVVGPAVATLVGLRISAQIAADRMAPFDALEAARAYAPPCPIDALDNTPVAMVAAGVSVESLHGQRWKLLEALLTEDPPVWDVLQFAHGPLQAIHARPMTLLVFGTRRADDLVSRLQRAVSATHHRVRTWQPTRDDALACFETAAAMDATLLATLRATPRNLFEWPGRGTDAPLYELDKS